jgi:nucleotide-binding universal stress UspA family protein
MVDCGAVKTILAPVDLSDAAEAVAIEAGALAKSIGARVRLLHVVSPPVANEYAPDAACISGEGTGAVEEALTRLRVWLNRKGVEAESRVLTGPPVPTILGDARRGKADYIVMGSHGHGALYQLLMGGTAMGVAQKAPCPVVIVPTGRNEAGLVTETLKTL